MSADRLRVLVRKLLRRQCPHEDVVAVYGLDGPKLVCRGCGYRERISMQEWRGL